MVLIVVGAFLWLGSAFLVDAIRRRRRRRLLLERLKPYRPSSVGDEAQGWLEDQPG